MEANGDSNRLPPTGGEATPAAWEAAPGELRQYLALLRRRWSWVAACVLLGGLGMLLYSRLSAPVFEAEVRLVKVHRPQPRLAGGERDSAQVDDVETDLEWARSEGPLNALVRKLRELGTPLAEDRVGLNPTDPVDPDVRGALKSSIEADVPRGKLTSNILIIKIRRPRADEALQVARLYADVFVQSDQLRRQGAIRISLESVEKEIEGKLKELREIDAEVVKFKDERKIQELDQETAILIRNWASYEEKYKEHMANLEATSRMIDDLENRYKLERREVVKTTFKRSPMQEELARLEIQRITLTERYQDTHPDVQKLAAKIESMKNALAESIEDNTEKSVEPNPVSEGIYMDLIREKARRIAYEAQANAYNELRRQTEADLKKIPAWGRELAEIQRQRDVVAKAYDRLLEHRQDLNIQINAIVSSYQPKEAPEAPVQIAPRPWRELLLGALAGLILGIALAFVVEGLDNTIGSAADVQRHLGLTVLGRVTRISPRESSVMTRGDKSHPLVEAYRILRFNITCALGDGRSKLLMVASARQGEGKSTTAVNLGLVSALDGGKVLLIDADLRRGGDATSPIQQHLIPPGGRVECGLVSYLTGRAKIKDIIVKSTAPDLYIIPAGERTESAPSLLASKEFATLLTKLREVFDFIVVDVPAALPVVDSSVICPLVDGVLVVVEDGVTTRDGARLTIDRLRRARGQILGAVLNKSQERDSADDYYYGYVTEG